MGAQLNRRKGLVSEINVTPFVDVMLVLLIIFMVTTPMMTEGLEVQLPQTTTVDALPTDSENVVLTIRKDGVMFLNTTETTMDSLDLQLKATVVDQQKVLYLQADQDVPYGQVVQIMGFAKGAGIESIAIVANLQETTDEPAQPEKPAKSAPARN